MIGQFSGSRYILFFDPQSDSTKCGGLHPIHSHSVFVGQKASDVFGIEQTLCQERLGQIPKAANRYELYVFLVSHGR
jgi:hypothetical protein